MGRRQRGGGQQARGSLGAASVWPKGDISPVPATELWPCFKWQLLNPRDSTAEKGGAAQTLWVSEAGKQSTKADPLPGWNPNSSIPNWGKWSEIVARSRNPGGWQRPAQGTAPSTPSLLLPGVTTWEQGWQSLLGAGRCLPSSKARHKADSQDDANPSQATPKATGAPQPCSHSVFFTKPQKPSPKEGQRVEAKSPEHPEAAGTGRCPWARSLGGCAEDAGVDRDPSGADQAVPSAVGSRAEEPNPGQLPAMPPSGAAGAALLQPPSPGRGLRRAAAPLPRSHRTGPGPGPGRGRKWRGGVAAAALPSAGHGHGPGRSALPLLPAALGGRCRHGAAVRSGRKAARARRGRTGLSSSGAQPRPAPT